MSEEGNTKPAGVSFAEWKKQKQEAEKKNVPQNKNNVNKNLHKPTNKQQHNVNKYKPPSLLDIDVRPPIDEYVPPDVRFNNYNEFFLPMQQPLDMQTIANPYTCNRPFMGPYNGPRPNNGPWPSNGPGPNNAPWPSNGPGPNNGPWQNSGPRQNNGPWPNSGPGPNNGPRSFNAPRINTAYVANNTRFNNNIRQNNASNRTKSENKRMKPAMEKKPTQEAQNVTEQKQPKEAKVNTPKVKKVPIPRPIMPPPMEMTQLSKEERKLQWKEFRQAMKPFKHKEFANAKRAIQRLSKRDRSTLEEWELIRLKNAEEYVAQHKLKAALKSVTLNGNAEYVKSEIKPTTADGKPVGELYVLQPKGAPQKASKPQQAVYNTFNNSFVPGGMLNK